MEGELELPALVATPCRGDGIVRRILGGVRAPIPQHDDPGAVAFRDDTFELTVFDRVILHAHSQPLGFWIERRTLGNGPRQ